MRMIQLDPFRELMARRYPSRGFIQNDGENRNVWNPAVDAIESEGNLVLTVDLPGVSRDEIGIQVEGGELRILGERVVQRDESAGQVHRRERASGKFERVFVLPENVNSGKTDARYKDGVLTITLPVAEEAKPRKITIHAA